MTPEDLGQAINESQEKLHSDFQEMLGNYYEQEDELFNDFQECIGND